MKKTIIWLAASLLFIVVGCVEGLHESGLTGTSSEQLPNLTAGFAEEETKTYVEDGKYLRWHEDDRLTAFYGYTRNRQYKFDGATGDNNGSFSHVSSGDLETGNPLDRIYAVYPYDATATITDNGQISLNLPAVQTYAENSFGRGANTMLAATENVEDTFLPFKNVCGYLKLKLYNSDGATIKSIEVKGNGDEKISGAAAATIAFGEVPQLTMADDATTTITLDCGEGVTLVTTKENATEFWVVIPETTFEGGITITVTDTEGGIFEKSTTKEVVIERNAVQPMAALEAEFVTPIVKPANNEIWYTSTDGKVVRPDKTNVFGANIVSNIYEPEKECWVITFDGDVTAIGNSAFWECNITSITIPDSVTSIGNGAFSRCSSLTSITIPDSVMSIGENAFTYCTSLRSLTIGKGVTSIGDSVFSECTGELIINCNIPSVNSSSGVFSGSKFTSVTVGDGVTKIGASAFFRCSSLTSITFSDSVTSIGKNAFSDCSSLKSANIGNSVTSIGDYAFSGCSSLTSITIPDSVTSIGESAFSGCSSLKSVNITDISSWCKIDFKDISSCPLSYYANLFINNELVTELVIPSDITEIKSYAFYSCSSLISVTIPESVTKIGNYAFRNCRNLTSVYCKAVTPPTGESYMFNWYSDSPNLKIYVPIASISAYKQGAWYNFNRLIVGYDFEDDGNDKIDGVVDMGLSVKWAGTNVGANSPEELGNLYAWGEVSPKEDYYFINYAWWTHEYDENEDGWWSYTTITKYGSSYSNWDYDRRTGWYDSYYWVNDGLTVLELKDDAASTEWGDTWRMPTQAECQELVDNCIIEKVKYNNCDGFLFTCTKEGYTDKWLFFPMTPYKQVGDETYFDKGAKSYSGLFWSSTQYLPFPICAYAFRTQGTSCTLGPITRNAGFPVRPVKQ